MTTAPPRAAITAESVRGSMPPWLSEVCGYPNKSSRSRATNLGQSITWELPILMFRVVEPGNPSSCLFSMRKTGLTARRAFLRIIVQSLRVRWTTYNACFACSSSTGNRLDALSGK
eukprot:scaffold2986_cov249-Pinguiococcus_pyrenoidosus.AAC.10